MALIKNAKNPFSKALNTGYGIATTAITKGPKAGLQKFSKDAQKGYSTPGGYLDVNTSTRPSVPSAYSVNRNQYSSPIGPQNKPNPLSTNSVPSTKGATSGTGSLYGGRQNTAAQYKSVYDNTASEAKKAYARQRQMELSAINDSFAEEQERLGGLEGQIRDQYAQADARFNEYLPKFEGQVATEKANQLGALENTRTQRQMESERALGQVRNALAELQRRQNAMLASTGGFNSSASNAAGEVFSRQAYQGLGNVQQQRQNAMAQIDEQRNKVNDFYSSKLLEGQTKIQEQKSALQQQFMGQLNAIATAQGQSAEAKRQATIDAWRNYTNVATQLNQQLAEQKISLDTWAAQAQQSLNSYAQQQVNPFTQSGITTDTSGITAMGTGGGEGAGNTTVGYNTGAWDDDNAQRVGAWDTMAYTPDAIDRITTPNIVRRLLG